MMAVVWLSASCGAECSMAEGSEIEGSAEAQNSQIFGRVLYIMECLGVMAGLFTGVCKNSRWKL